jgi:hypothetical protein
VRQGRQRGGKAQYAVTDVDAEKAVQQPAGERLMRFRRAIKQRQVWFFRFVAGQPDGPITIGRGPVHQPVNPGAAQ